MQSADVEEQRRADESREALLISEGGIKKETMERIDKLADIATLSFASRATKGYAPRFVKAAKTSLRVAFWTWLTGLGVWALRRCEVLPDVYVNALPGVVIAIIFNVTTNVASTVQSVIQAFVGTGFALVCSYFLFMLPDPGAGSQSIAGVPTCPANLNSPARLLAAADFSKDKDELFEWYCVDSTGLLTADDVVPAMSTAFAFALYLIFVAVTLSLNVVMPFKTFALVGAVNYFMMFANPTQDTEGAMDLRWESALVVTLVTQLAGSVIAIFAMLLPPVTATMSSKALAARATKVTAELLLFITQYYCGSAKTLMINVYNSQLTRNREDMASINTDLNSAWWEFFDWGSAGVVRNLMNDHLKMLKDLARRLQVMQISVLREGFEESHKKAITAIKEPMMQLVHNINVCLLTCTICASDGKFSRDELDVLAKQRDDVNDALKELSSQWRSTRGDIKDALSAGMRAEGFFLLELSTVGRMVAEFTDEVVDDAKRPKPKALAWDAFKNIISKEKMQSKEFRNFVLRNWISLTLAWCWAAVANNYATSVPINVVFMLTELPGNSMLMNLQKLQASVLGSLAGTVLYRAFHYCTSLTRILKLASLFAFEIVAMFIANYTKEFANVGLLLAVYGGGKLMMVCDERTTNGEVLAMNSAEFRGLRFFAYAMCIVSVVDTLLKPKLACDLAREKLLEAMDVSFDYFKKYLRNEVAIGRDEVWQETADITEKVEGLLTEAEDLTGAADQEPRFAKGPFKTALFKDMCNRTRQMTLNAQVLIRRSQGAYDKGLMAHMLECKSFSVVKDDLLQTIDNTTTIVKKVIMYDGFGAMPTTTFDDLLGETDVDKVDGLKRLEADVIALDLTTSAEAEISLEYGRISRFAVVFELLELYVEDLASMMSASVLNM